MKKRFVYMIVILLVLGFSGIVSISYGDTAVGFYPPQPKDVTVLISKPTVSMQLIINDNNKIQSMDMLINSKKVNVLYDADMKNIYHVPQEALMPGVYKVNLTVIVEGYKPIVQSWQFTVSDNALESLPASTSVQIQALNYSNIYRKLLNIKELQINHSLNMAAMAHANYMAVNKIVSHDEFSNKNGFTGALPYQRATAFGYTGGYVAENASSGQKDYKEAIDGLFVAPYHRLMWLNPYLTDFGYGFRDKYYNFDLGGKKAGEDSIIVYPMENQVDLPISWDGNETPNPLRLHPKEGTVGYPITLSYFTGKEITKFSISKAQLTNNKGTTISTFLNTPVLDKNLQESIIIIPQSPLAKGEKYTVAVKGLIEFKDKPAMELDKVWSFTTAASEVEQDAWKNIYLYNDLDGHWARDIIIELLRKQIVTPKSDRLYMPEVKITRGEFAEFIVNALGFQTKEYVGAFKDVKSDNNKAIFIESAYGEGIIQGVGNGYFMPNRLITREEMAVMIIKGYEKKKGTNALQSMPLLSFNDKNDISGWATEAVRASAYLGIIKGRTTSRFVPKDSATRAEAAVMIQKLLDTF